LHRLDFVAGGFQWLSCDDSARSVVAFCRFAAAGEPNKRDEPRDFLIVALNFTPVPREAYRIGVPRAGRYREIFNSDSAHYGGSNLGNLASVTSRREPSMGWSNSIDLLLPPLAAVILLPEP
jgi:1,4-alpha-glucan branching enzyme